MQRIKLVLLLLLMASTSLIGQDVDYYKALADSTQNQALRLEAMDSVLSLTRRTNPDVFSEYSIKYIELAKDLDSIELAGKKLINAAYTLTSIKKEPRKVITLIDGILARKYKINDSFVVGGLYLKRGSANYRLDLNEAVKDYDNAIQSFTEKDSLYVADAYLFSGQAFSNLGNFVKAGENYRKAYEYFESLKDYEYMFYAQQGITTMFSMNGFQEKAMEERERNIIKIKELGLEHHLVTEYYNQALDYQKLDDEANHLEYLLKASKEIDKSKNPSVNAILVYSKLVEYYCNSGNFEQAKNYLDLIAENYNDEEGDHLTKSHFNGAHAAYSYALGESNDAVKYGELKLEYSKKLNFEEDIMSAHKLLSEIYEQKGDYRRSLENKKAYTALRDSIYNQSTANSLAYYQTLYETEKNEKELVEKTTSIQLLEKDNTYFKNLLAVIVVSFILTFGIVLLYRNQRNLKSKKVLQERFSQELLVSQEEERRRISKDLHDGLGQQLLLIKNKLIATGDEDTKQMVDNTIEEVRAISRSLHPFQLQEMGITKAIKYTLNQIDENTTLFISSEIDNIDNIFTQEQEVNIYRIVQESLSNIIKHAKAEAGKVSVKKLAGGVSISIKDNGVGFDFNEKYNDTKSLGLKTLMERTKFLNGQMRINSRRDVGTLIEFQFPMV